MTKSGPAQGSIYRALGQPCTDSTLGTGGSLASFTDAEKLECGKNARIHKAWPEEGGGQQETTDGPPRVMEGRSQNRVPVRTQHLLQQPWT